MSPGIPRRIRLHVLPLSLYKTMVQRDNLVQRAKTMGLVRNSRIIFCHCHMFEVLVVISPPFIISGVEIQKVVRRLGDAISVVSAEYGQKTRTD